MGNAIMHISTKLAILIMTIIVNDPRKRQNRDFFRDRCVAYCFTCRLMTPFTEIYLLTARSYTIWVFFSVVSISMEQKGYTLGIWASVLCSDNTWHITSVCMIPTSPPIDWSMTERKILFCYKTFLLTYFI